MRTTPESLEPRSLLSTSSVSHSLLIKSITMLAFVRFFVLLAPIALAAPLVVRDSAQGQPVSVARTADRSVEASNLFGTTTDSPNFTEIPTTLCIVPKYANEAGIGEEKTPLIAQQALDLCPRAERIAVCDN
ncbi:unnamed protein product [Rhizoctonia solani]|uniref:Uncharacterized protein n=1 Tax=Rhizoctonia solani TaxID=456999 RepID=A0A8H3DB68_9AGAM|nr:unnamed protein product [Rhizoctonia solani]